MEDNDFSWLELPEAPKDNSYMEKVRYALENTEFRFKRYLTLEDNLLQITDNTEYPSTLLSLTGKDFTADNLKLQSQKYLLILYKYKLDVPLHDEVGCEKIITLHERLFKILKQIQ